MRESPKKVAVVLDNHREMNLDPLPLGLDRGSAMAPQRVSKIPARPVVIAFYVAKFASSLCASISSSCGSVRIVLLLAISWFATCVGIAQAPVEVRSVPLPPSKSIDQFSIAGDLRIELVACEPQVIDPIAMQFDEQGHMWVVEMRDYPHPRIDAEGKILIPRGCIKVLRDRDGDGFFESAKIFADNLLFPTGIQLFRDGAIVTLAGEIAYFQDRDGDGVSDEKTTWFTGFEEGNEQLRANHPTYTIENTIHVASGLRGGTVRCVHPEWNNNEQGVSLSQRDLEFNPYTGEWHAVAGNSQFGFHQDSSGRQYICSNRNPCELLMAQTDQVSNNASIPLSQWQVSVMPSAESSRVFPLVSAWTTSNLHAGQFTAACSVFRYESDLLAEPFGASYFACEPTASLIQQYVTTREGLVPETKPAFEDREVLASRDSWFRPVSLVDGPDGALYVVDMHRAVIEHPDWMPTELRTREDMRWGEQAGRIYRLVPGKTSDATPAPSVNSKDVDSLVSQLKSANHWARSTAGRLLAEELHAEEVKVRSGIVALLREMLSQPSREESSFATISALWLLESADALSHEHLTAQALSESWMVRRQVVRLLAQSVDHDSTAWREAWIGLAADRHPAVRYQWLLEVAGGAPASSALLHAAIALDSDLPEERIWIARALSSVPPNESAAILPQLISTQGFKASEWMPLWNRMGWERQMAGLKAVLDAEVDAAAEDVVWNGFVRAMLSAGHTWQEFLPTLDHAFRNQVEERIRGDRKLVQSEEAPVSSRLQALERALADRSDATLHVCRQIVATRQFELWSGAIRGLRRSQDLAVGDELAAAIPELPPGTMRSTITLMIQHRPWTGALMSSLESDDIPVGFLDAAAWQRLETHPDANIADRAKRLRATLQSQDVQEIFSHYKLALAEDADLVRGKALFKQHCATCHRIDGEGFRVGPEISDLRTTSEEQVLLSVLDPNSAIDAAYFRYVVLTTDGQVFDGLLRDRQQNSVTLLLQGGELRTIAADRIESVKSTGVSLMPTGMDKELNPSEMRDVIAYVKRWRYLQEVIPGVSTQ